MNRLDRFNTIWHTDFEYRQDANLLPVPVSMCAIEQRTGVKVEMQRDELLRCRKAPFEIGDNSAMVAYMAAAELGCFEALGWQHPKNVIDLYAEVIAAINGDDAVWLRDERRPGLQDAVQLHGFEPLITPEEKQYWRRIILDNNDYSAEQLKGIQDYNRTDVLETLALIEKMAPALDVTYALYRGRYMGAVARMEAVGIPVSRPKVDRLTDHGDALRRHFIKCYDTFGLYDDLSFRNDRLSSLAAARGWQWPLTDKGTQFATDGATWRLQAERYPELKSEAHLHNMLGGLRFGDLQNTIGRDSHSRCSLRPFQTITGRNQPSERGKIFLPALPKWVSGVIAPAPGWGVAELDYVAQELLAMAERSGDEVMLADYLSGDPYLAFGIRAGLIPADADDKHPLRKPCKEVVLGMLFGMSPYGIVAKTGKSMEWARYIHRRHRQVYWRFHQWLGDTIASANFPAQSAGAEMMRIATMAATESGVLVAAPVHDALWITARLSDLEATIEHTRDLMARASVIVTGGHAARVKVEHVVRYPDCLGDVRDPKDRGQEMWLQVNALIDSGELRRAA